MSFTTKITAMKLLDRGIGKLIVQCLPRPSVRTPAAFQSFLLIRPGGIGDAVLLIPTILSLKKSFPDAAIEVLAEKRNSAAFSLCRNIDDVYHYDRPRELLAVLRKKYDVVIDTEQWHRLSAVIARMTGAPMLIGYGTNERRRLFTHVVPYSLDEYELAGFFRLLEPLQGTMALQDAVPFLFVSPELAKSAKQVLQPLHSRVIVALFPGGSIREKRWNIDKFRQTANMLVEQGYGVVIVGGKEDRRNGSEIAAGFTAALNLCGALSLQETAAVLQCTSLLITGDSGIMHLAYGLGTKILAIFGPGNEKKWAPRGPSVVVIKEELYCRPCSKFGYTPRCKHRGECMDTISVADVYGKAVGLLEG